MEEHRLYYLNTSMILKPNESYLIGRAHDADICLPDERVSRRHASLVWTDLEKDSGFVLKDLGSTNGTFVNGSRAEKVRLLDGDRLRVGPHDLQYVAFRPGETAAHNPDDTLIFERKVHELAQEAGNAEMAGRIRDLKRYYNRKRDSLSDLAFRDELTGLFNRRYFDHKLRDEIDRSARYGRDLSLIMVDIDHFKSYNDEFGHQKGDEVLKVVADLLQSGCRSSDTAARYGGEEMAVILPETPAGDALKAAEKMRELIELGAVRTAGRLVTISAGICGYSRENGTAEMMIGAADKALYQAKEMGRNRCIPAKNS